MLIRTILLLVIPLAAAWPAEQKPAAAKARPKAQARQTDNTIPARAVEFEPNHFRYTDANGKTWLYRKTPFGVFKREETPESRRQAEVKEEPPDTVTAVEDGDSIRFERQMPFGPLRWTRKKTELTEMETAVWERERAKSAKK